MNRVVFTVATGAPKYVEQAVGLGRSLRLLGDPTPRVLMTDRPDLVPPDAFDSVVPPAEGVPTYLRKLSALDATAADEVVFVDSDALFFRRTDEIWLASMGADLAVQGTWISQGHWYGWSETYLPRLGLPAIPRFNGGLMVYRRTDAARAVIDEAIRIAASYDELGLDRFRGTVPDEPCVAVAIARLGIGRVVDERLDLMNTPVGLVGRLEMDVMRGRCRFLKHGMFGIRLIRPAVLHAGKYVNNLAYWRQVWTLERLAELEARQPFGYMTRGHRLRRSLERRWLRFTGRPV